MALCGVQYRCGVEFGNFAVNRCASKGKNTLKRFAKLEHIYKNMEETS